MSTSRRRERRNKRARRVRDDIRIGTAMGQEANRRYHAARRRQHRNLVLEPGDIEHAEAVAKLTNWQRGRWAAAGYPRGAQAVKPFLKMRRPC